VVLDRSELLWGERSCEWALVTLTSPLVTSLSIQSFSRHLRKTLIPCPSKIKSEREREKERERESGINSISTSMTVMPCGCTKGTFRTKHLFIVGSIDAISR